MSVLKKIIRTTKEKFLLFVWEILEILPRLKKFVYRFYDRFWYLERLIGSGNKTILNNQNNKYFINIDRFNIEDSEEFKFVQDHFLKNKKWESIKAYNKLKIKYTKPDFKLLLIELDNVYKDVQNSSLDVEKPSIIVDIGKTGNFVLVEGIYNISILKLLNKERGFIEVRNRHPDWIEFKRDLLEYLSFHQDIYQPLLHPDLKTIKTSYTEERFGIIKDHLQTKSGTLLDIGSNFGFFCHKFEELGFNCYAVEIRPRNVYFMRKLRDFEGKHFNIINKSIFNITEKLDYDVILALNIFHHFLKDKGLFQNLVKFLRNIKTKEMIFQPHNPKEKVMRNIYINFFPQEFVEFILNNSCLTKYELIVKRVSRDNKDRPIYRLFR